MNKTIKILILCLLTTFGYAQKQNTKIAQSLKVNKDVVVELNTSYVEIEVDTWNKDVVDIEAYIEGEKLSESELKDALKAWNLKVDGSLNRIIISSEGGSLTNHFPNGDYDNLLKKLEFDLADLPDLPTLEDFPEIPNMKNFPAFPEMPEVPEFPELPELPEGVNSVQFDYDKYQKEGEKYLSEWSQKYEKQGGKELQKRMKDWAKKFADSDFEKKMKKWGKDYGNRFAGKWSKDIEKWAEQFDKGYSKDVEKWAKDFGETFGEEWAEKMEAWSEGLGKKMEKQSRLLEKQTELQKRNAELLERQAELNKRLQERKEALEEKREERKTALEERRDKIRNERARIKNSKNTFFTNRFDEGNSKKIRKVIKIKIPKKAKLNLNVRHGELKIASVLHNIKGDVSHTFLVAEHIDGKDTSINVSYSPVIINTWALGTLNLNFVDKAQIKEVSNLVLNSKSSNISIGNLTDTGIIDWSFGDLTISNLSDTFKMLNVVLENSDALVNLPNAVDYNLYFTGNRSKYNNKITTQKTIRKDNKGQSSNRNIIVNAKFSNVIMN